MAKTEKIYEMVTDQIVKALESGNIPWHKPWAGGSAQQNLVSKKAYRGINPWILAARGFASPYWMSYKQAQSLGGTVRKGEKGTAIVFWNVYTAKSAKDEEKEEKRFTLCYYKVFNAEQCDLPEGTIPEAKTDENVVNPIEACEAIVNAMENPPTIKEGEPRAYYRQSEDLVNMPVRNLFDGSEEYYSTLFHELGHATGHPTRLGRFSENESQFFGSADYSTDELVAEFTAAFLCGETGIALRTVDNSAAYIQGWLKKLKGDVKLVFQAAGKAQKAADYILNRKFDKNEKKD
jgi:antirestriction protein ArdC